MKKKIAMLAIAGTSMGMFAGASPASAGHCVVVDADGNVSGDTPGFSYFGTVHVQGDAHANEGGPKHAGTPGASNCNDGNPSPATRAPGQNKG